MAKRKGTIGVLTGGGDVPGLNPAIRALTVRALLEGYRVLGIRRGWAGLVDLVRDPSADNSASYLDLDLDIVNRASGSGGTFLHSSRTRPSHLPKTLVPEHLRNHYSADVNDITPEIVKNLEWLGVDTLVPIGGDDTLSYGHRLHDEGFKVIAVPKTMDNDVPGTDYCIGFGTCVTRTIELARKLRTSAGSHERFLVIEIFGRYAGFSALMPTLAGAADRCLIPEHPFDIEQLCGLMIEDRERRASSYSVVLVSEGATFRGQDHMVFSDEEKDQYGHKKLGGIGDKVSAALKKCSPKMNNGRRINVVNQRLGYLVRSGDPDMLDSIVPMAFGNLALDLILQGESGRLVVLRDGRYDHVPIGIVTGEKKVVDVEKYYDIERLRPRYDSFQNKPLLVMTSGGSSDA